MSGDEKRQEGTDGAPAVDGGDEAARARKDAEFARDALPWLPDVTRFAHALARNDDDAADLVQETFLRAYDYWHTFIPGSDGRRWLFTICRNLFLRKKRRDKVVVSVGDDAEVETLAAVMLHNEAKGAGLDDMFSRLDLGPAIAAAIAGLPEVYGAAVKLVDVAGLDYAEAAAALDVPVGTVRSRLFRGRRLLQRELIDYARDAGFASVKHVGDSKDSKDASSGAGDSRVRRDTTTGEKP